MENTTTTIERRLEKSLNLRKKDGSIRILNYSKEKTLTLQSNSNITYNEVVEEEEAKRNNHPDTFEQRQLIDFSSNDYLGFAHCPDQLQKVSSKFNHYIEKNQRTKLARTPFLGATGSRLLSGDSPLSHTIEESLAKFHNQEKALLFNSGYDANLSVLSCIPYPNDFVIVDELCHNSLLMGLRMARWSNTVQQENHETMTRRKTKIFRHNDLNHLNQILNEICQLQKKNNIDQYSCCILIVVESIYSMDGDVAPLAQILYLAKKYNASVIVDEAHGLGVYGKTNAYDLKLPTFVSEKINPNDSKKIENNESKNIGGTGVIAALGLEHHPNLLCSIYTFGKAAGCHGAVVVASNTVIQYLINYARPFIYSTALPVHSLISIQCAYEAIISGIDGEKRRSHVFQLVKLFRKMTLKYNIPTLASPSPIQAVMVNTLSPKKYKSNFQIQMNKNDKINHALNNHLCIMLVNQIRAYGMIVYPIRYPTVKKGEERIRIIIHAHNTKEHIFKLMNVLRNAFNNSDTGDFCKNKKLEQKIFHKKLNQSRL